MISIARDTIRASSLPGYPDCPRRWAARQLRTEIETAGYRLRTTGTSIAAAIGTGVHGGAAYLLKEKMLGRKPFDAEDEAVDVFREAIHDGEILMDEKTAPTKNDAEKQVTRMLAAFERGVLPAVNPIMVEERLQAIRGNITLSGQGDNLCEEPNALRDLKTGARAGMHRPQLGAYSLLYRSHGRQVHRAIVDFIPRVSLRQAQPEVISTEYDASRCETAALRVLDHIERDMKLFREGDGKAFLPGDPWAFAANPSSMLCSERWCPAFGSDFCKEHQGAK